MFQRHSRRWSRIVDLPLDFPPASESNKTAVTDGRVVGDGVDLGVDTNEQVQLADENETLIGQFRRSSSERLRHGAKSLLRRMESLRSRARRHRPSPLRSTAIGEVRQPLVIGTPKIVDQVAMRDRVKDLNCVDLTPPDSETPSPDLQRQTSSSSVCAGKTSQNSLDSKSTPTNSSKGSLKFLRTSLAFRNEQKDASLSDSECNPGYWRRSLNSTPNAKNGAKFEDTRSSLRKFKKKNQTNISDTVETTQSLRARLNLNFKPSIHRQWKNALFNTPDEEEQPTSVTTILGHPTSPIPMRHNVICQDAACTPTAKDEHQDSVSTGTATSGSHIDSDYSPAQCARYVAKSADLHNLLIIFNK